MALTNASTQKSYSDTATGSLSFLNTIISGASSNGLYHVFVDGSLISNTITGSLISGGYKLTPVGDSMGSNVRYKISWE